jgi:hypothetical protein
MTRTTYLAVVRGLARGLEFRKKELEHVATDLMKERTAFVKLRAAYASSSVGATAGCPPPPIGEEEQAPGDPCAWGCQVRDCPAHEPTRDWTLRVGRCSNELSSIEDALLYAKGEAEYGGTRPYYRLENSLFHEMCGTLVPYAAEDVR